MLRCWYDKISLGPLTTNGFVRSKREDDKTRTVPTTYMFHCQYVKKIMLHITGQSITRFYTVFSSHLSSNTYLIWCIKSVKIQIDSHIDSHIDSYVAPESTAMPAPLSTPISTPHQPPHRVLYQLPYRLPYSSRIDCRIDCHTALISTPIPTPMPALISTPVSVLEST